MCYVKEIQIQCKYLLFIQISAELHVGSKVFHLKKYTFIQQGHIKLIKSDIVMFPIRKQIHTYTHSLHKKITQVF